MEVDVTLLSVADRLATRGRKSEEAIERHVDLAREVLPAVAGLARRRRAPRAAAARRRARTARSASTRGPSWAACCARCREAQYAGEVTTSDEAVELAQRAAQRVLSRSTTPSTTPTASRTERKSTLSGVSVGAW